MSEPREAAILAIDLGAESGRAILGQIHGGKLVLTEIHRFANQPTSLPDGLHWDVLSLWNEIKLGIRKAVQTSPQTIRSIGIDTWGVDFGLLDRDGILIGNPYHYRDGRTDGVMEKAFARISRDEIFSQTGLQFMQLNTLYQLYAMVLANNSWLETARTFLTIPDLLNYWMTGRKVCEFTIATTTQCYDPRLRTWAKPLLERLNIPTHIFPEIVQPGTILGPLTQQVCEETGAGDLIVIAPACHDTGSAVAAVPASGKEFAWISSGTWSIMGIEADQPVVTPQSQKFNVTNEGGVNNTIRLSKNIMGLWLVQECKRTWARQGKEFSYDELTKMASEATPLQSFIDPDHEEFLKPGDMPARIKKYCQATGQVVPETPGEVVRCALQGIALKYRYVLDMLEALHGAKLEKIHIVGGGTRNRLLSQFTADATDRTVITGPIEATAVGNIIIQAISLGIIQDMVEARTVIADSFEMSTYIPATNLSSWQAAYSRFKDLLS